MKGPGGNSSVSCYILVVFVLLRSVSSDSYIEAYKQSQNEKLDAVLVKGEKDIDREFVESNDLSYQYGTPSGNQNYGPPQPQYQQNPNYGTPVYGPPAQAPPPVYGPPAPPPPPVYGPPAPPPPPVYSPPIYGAPSSVQVFYGMPHALNTFWEKLKFKLDVFTIGKILLKLVLFKKFVSFVAVICLLLFLPSLKNKLSGGINGGDDGSFRMIEKIDNEKINRMYNSIYNALDYYSKQFEDPKTPRKGRGKKNR